MKRKLLVTSFHSIISRNILQTEVLQELKEKFQVTLVVPAEKVDFFRESFGDEVGVVGHGLIHRRGEETLKLFSISMVSVENLYVRRLKDERKYVKLGLAYFSHYVLGLLPFMPRVFRWIDHRFFTDHTISSVFAEVDPAIVFATDIYHPGDKEVLKEARKRRVPTVGMVRSWDNVRTKGVLVEVPEKIIVHTKVLQDELTELYHFGEDKIEITGIPHYDAFHRSRTSSREEFCARLGLDPTKKIILFAPGGRILFKDDGKLLALFESQLAAGKIPSDAQFLVRFPPNDTIVADGFEPKPPFVIDVPGTAAGNRRKDNEMSLADEAHLIDTLYHSDVVITLVSTIVIDSAVFNTPTIVLSFNVDGHTDDVNKFAKYSHFSKFLSFNTVRMADTEEEFLELLNTYLEHKDADADMRGRIRELYCHSLDRNASKRVAVVVTKRGYE